MFAVYFQLDKWVLIANTKYSIHALYKTLEIKYVLFAIFEWMACSSRFPHNFRLIAAPDQTCVWKCSEYYRQLYDCCWCHRLKHEHLNTYISYESLIIIIWDLHTHHYQGYVRTRYRLYHKKNRYRLCCDVLVVEYGPCGTQIIFMFLIFLFSYSTEMKLAGLCFRISRKCSIE